MSKPIRKLSEEIEQRDAERWIAQGRRALLASGVDGGGDPESGEPMDQMIGDTIVALLHLANSLGIDAEKCAEKALFIFDEETVEA